MHVEAHDGFRNPLKFRATRLLVRDGLHGNIAAVLVEQVPGRIEVIVAGSPNFTEQLELLGIHEGVIVTPSKLPHPPKISM